MASADAMMFGRTALLVAMLAPIGAAVPQVDIYFEMGCHVCKDLLTGLHKQSAALGQSMTVKLHPWGNTYFVTQECGGGGASPGKVSPDPRYSPTSRECWDTKCGADAATKAADCFTGEMICQYGPPACELQSYAICANQALGADWQRALQFSACLDSKFDMGTKYGWPKGTVKLLAGECAEKVGLDMARLKQCVRGPEGAKGVLADAKQIPTHTVVPHVTVDGMEVEGAGADLNILLSAVSTASARRLLV